MATRYGERMDINRLRELGTERGKLLARVEEIRAEADPLIAKLRAEEVAQKDIAAAYGVDRDAIRLIVKREGRKAG